LPGSLGFPEEAAVSEVPTPAEIENAEFHVTVRGYARDEVREYLTELAVIVGRLQERTSNGYLDLGERMGELLQDAKDAADELIGAAHAQGQRAEEDARIRAADIIETAERHAAKIVQEAELKIAELRTVEDAVRGEMQSLRAQLDELAGRLRPLEHAALP
jgi:DivIVA domain-containing protein